MKPAIAYLSAGSNLGDRKAHLRKAVHALPAAGVEVLRVSSVYHTEPVGTAAQPWFLNVAVCIRTGLAPVELLTRLLEIESTLGRVRSVPGAPRTVDLDILLYDDLILDEPVLRIPHPRMARRRFVLEPLAEIAPQAVHPRLNATIRSLLEACPDPAAVLFHSAFDDESVP
jgi:2-amino-4-hydroxy-6-hydroxymethyldihydropteridine diphosphokinase